MQAFVRPLRSAAPSLDEVANKDSYQAAPTPPPQHPNSAHTQPFQRSHWLPQPCTLAPPSSPACSSTSWYACMRASQQQPALTGATCMSHMHHSICGSCCTARGRRAAGRCAAPVDSSHAILTVLAPATAVGTTSCATAATRTALPAQSQPASMRLCQSPLRRMSAARWNPAARCGRHRLRLVGTSL